MADNTIAQAYVQILPTTEGIQSQLTEQLGGEAASAGMSAGGAFSGAFSRALGGIADFAKSVVNVGMNFDAEMSKVQAISGASSDAMEQLREKAEDMGAKTKFSASEAAQAFQYMAMAGWKDADMLNGIEGIMNLAAASGENLATTSDIVTDALTAFGLTAADSGHFADILAAASSNANTNVYMMGETFKYVAPVAGALNASAEDVAEAVGLMANSGIKASQAGTSLRSIMTRIATDAGASSKSLGALGILTEELGVDFYDTEGNVRDFSDVLDDAREAWQSLSAEDAATFAKKIAGEEGISAWLAMMNTAPEDLAKLRGAILDCDGAAEQMANTMQDNLAGDITTFNSALEGFKIALSEQITPILREFVQFGTDGLRSLTDQIGPFTTVVASLTAGFIAYKTVTLATTVAENGLAIAQAALNAVMSLNPIGLIIAGISALVAAFVYLWNTNEEFREFWIQTWEDIKKFFIDSWSAIKDFFVNDIPETYNTIVDYLGSLPEKARQWGNNIGQNLINGLEEQKANLDNTVRNLGDALNNYLERTSDRTPTLGRYMLTQLANGMSQGLPGLYDLYKRIRDAFFETIKSLVSLARQWGRDLIQNFISGIRDRWNSLRDTVSNTAQTVRNFIGFSEPEEGPLSDFHTFPRDMMQLFGEGIEQNEDLVTSPIKRVFALRDLITSAPSQILRDNPQRAADQGSGRPIILQATIVNEMDGEQLSRKTYQIYLDESNRHGVSLVNA